MCTKILAETTASSFSPYLPLTYGIKMFAIVSYIHWALRATLPSDKARLKRPVRLKRDQTRLQPDDMDFV